MIQETGGKLSKAQIRLIWKNGFEAVCVLIEELQEANTILDMRVAELERRLGMNSRNSSKPPSSDQSRPPPKSLKTKTGRKSGGQKGHKGHTLEKHANPDTVHELALPSGSLCGCGCTKETSRPLSPEVRQVIEIPEIKISVVEYRAEKVRGKCGKIHVAEFPPDVKAHVQYGKNLKAFALYLSDWHLLPQERTCQVMHDIFGITMSEGTLNNIRAEADRKLEQTSLEMQKHLAEKEVLGSDETQCFISREKFWQHCVCDSQFTHYSVQKERGLSGIERASPLLIRYSGVLLHDCFRAYFNLPLASHALCNVHLLRELTGIAEMTGEKWPERMAQLLVSAKDLSVEARINGETSLPDDRKEKVLQQYRKILLEGFLAHPEKEKPEGKKGRVKQSPAFNLLTRLSQYESEILLFMENVSVSFHNNQVRKRLADDEGETENIRWFQEP
jgi:transposase